MKRWGCNNGETPKTHPNQLILYRIHDTKLYIPHTGRIANKEEEEEEVLDGVRIEDMSSPNDNGQHERHVANVVRATEVKPHAAIRLYNSPS